jgi:hypothetical protein
MGYRRPSMLCVRILLKHSARGWVYHPDQGWTFDILTHDEFAVLKAVKPDQPVRTGRVGFPKGSVWHLRNYDLERKRFANWFGRCTITELHPMALAHFRIRRILEDRIEEVFEYSLEPGIYECWLWADEVANFQALGCNITVHEVLGWKSWLPPTKSAPRYQEHIFIYALVDPFSKEVRYLGMSENPQRRLFEHLKDTNNPYKAWWIQRLEARGQVPTLIILEEVDGIIAPDRELWWIAFYQEQGHNLTNINSQGYLQKTKIDKRKEQRRLSVLRKNAKMHGQLATLTFHEWSMTLAFFGWKCAYCACRHFEALDFIVPLQQGGELAANNCIPVCRACERVKKTLNSDELLAFHGFLAYLSTTQMI